MRTHRTALVAAVLAPGLLLAACAGDDNATGEDSAADDGQVIEVTISGDSVEPNGDRVEVDIDRPVVLDITADRAGELHVHSDPEQEIEFDEGTTQAELTFDKPGVVEVEEHESDQVLMQLELS